MPLNMLMYPCKKITITTHGLLFIHFTAITSCVSTDDYKYLRVALACFVKILSYSENITFKVLTYSSMLQNAMRTHSFFTIFPNIPPVICILQSIGII